MTILVLSAVLFLILARDKLIESFLEVRVTFLTGVKLNIGSLKTDFLRARIKIQDLHLYNPNGYEERLMADIPEIYIDVDLSKLLRGEIYFEELRFYLKELNIVRNEERLVNVDKLIPFKKEPASGEHQEKGLERKISKIGVKTLYLKADKVSYADYSKTKEPLVQEFNVKLELKYNNIGDLDNLIRILASNIFKETIAENLVNMPIKKIENTVKEAYLKGVPAVKKAIGSAVIFVKDLFKKTMRRT